jgi:hypothetical protein
MALRTHHGARRGEKKRQRQLAEASCRINLAIGALRNANYAAGAAFIWGAKK